MKFPVGLQPYTIRKELSKDYLGSIKKVADIGYTGIELGPPKDLSTSELKTFLAELGLQVISSHASLELLENDLDSLINYLQEVGGKYVVLSYKFDTKEQVLECAKRFNKIGEKCKKRGIQFLYHNHDWEFIKFDGEYALDLLLAETDPDLVKMELDTYWVKRGGEDPVVYLQKLKGRCPVLHIKDMEPGEEQFFAEIGEGILDFSCIIKAAEEVGTEWLVVEQDQSRKDIFESIEISYQNLKNFGFIE